jgi:hypothetical protein
VVSIIAGRGETDDERVNFPSLGPGKEYETAVRPGERHDGDRRCVRKANWQSAAQAWDVQSRCASTRPRTEALNRRAGP